MSSSEAESEEGPITEERIREAIDELLPTVDLATTGVKSFRKMLSNKKFGGANLKPFNDFVKEALTEAINNQASEEEEEEEEEESEEETPKKKAKGKGGYNAPKELSAKLAKFVGAAEMSRPQIVKALWEYIKEHDLQNPDNRKEILLDAKMKKVFGCDKFDMFSMNKYISCHTHPFPKLDLTKKTPTKKRAAPKSKEGSAKTPRKAGTQPPYRLSDALVAVLGKEVAPRPQVVSGLWVYIKDNNLQNPDDKREILCDDKLKAVFKGRKSVTMFSMNKFISDHLLEKVDKSEYAGDEQAVDADESE